MKKILLYIDDYFRAVSKKRFFFVSLLTALLVFSNYYFRLEPMIEGSAPIIKYMAWVLIFSVAWLLPYSLTGRNKTPVLLLAWPPFLFALKMTLDFRFRFSPDGSLDKFWNHVIYWPIMLLIIGGLVYITGRISRHDQPFYGSGIQGVDWKPYWVMLAMMLPLVAAASMQPDFQELYPRIKQFTGLDAINGSKKLLFELSYGSDFISIEYFFRGFLVLAFARWAGKDAILPMACFYCTIHFGKPLGECISSYFGGLLLGIVVYNTRSIFGGLLVHLGIAWMMELFGYLAAS